MSPLGPKKKGIRFNLYWMYSLIALVLIGLYYMNDNTMSKEVNWTEFEKIAKEGGITRLTVFAKKDYAEAQLNDSTAKAVFKTDKINGKPVIYTNIPSGDSFAKTLDTWKKEDGFNAEVYYENSSDLTNILWSVGPFILLIVFWIYLARRMTNQGGGGSGGVFNVGKAKAQLRWQDPQRRLIGRPSGNRKNIIGKGRCRRSQRPVFLFIWFRFRRNVRRCGSLSCSRSFQTSQRESSVYRLYR